MRFYNKREFLGILIILLAIVIVTFINIRISLTIARDNQRIADLDRLVETLANFYRSFGSYPLSSEDGRILYCSGEQTQVFAIEQRVVDPAPCDWGKDPLTNLFHPDDDPYLNPIPADPLAHEGVAYQYYSDGETYLLMTTMERKKTQGFSEALEEKGIPCGLTPCNYYKASDESVLDNFSEEYQNK